MIMIKIPLSGELFVHYSIILLSIILCIVSYHYSYIPFEQTQSNIVTHLNLHIIVINNDSTSHDSFLSTRWMVFNYEKFNNFNFNITTTLTMTESSSYFISDYITNKSTIHLPVLNLGFIIDFFLMFIPYLIMYFTLGILYEISHPDRYNPARRLQIYEEIYLTIIALAYSLAYSLLWMKFIIPYLPYTDYYLIHNQEFNLRYYLTGFIVYCILFESWTYFTHYFNHKSKWAYHSYHYEHHVYHYPTAFGCIADHPIESISAATAHFIPLLFYPFPTSIHNVYGVINTFISIAAHDGRLGDFMNHAGHHKFGNVNYGGFSPLWDKLFNTNMSQKQLELQRTNNRAIYSTYNLFKKQPANPIKVE